MNNPFDSPSILNSKNILSIRLYPPPTPHSPLKTCPFPLRFLHLGMLSGQHLRVRRFPTSLREQPLPSNTILPRMLTRCSHHSVPAGLNELPARLATQRRQTLRFESSSATPQSCSSTHARRTLGPVQTSSASMRARAALILASATRGSWRAQRSILSARRPATQGSKQNGRSCRSRRTLRPRPRHRTAPVVPPAPPPPPPAPPRQWRQRLRRQLQGWPPVPAIRRAAARQRRRRRRERPGRRRRGPGPRRGSTARVSAGAGLSIGRLG